MAKLVAIGDSITQGFQSLAITYTDLSYPALIAERMGLDLDSFRLPTFYGCGGLPCSLEWLARRLEDKYGADLSAFDWLRSLHTIPSLLDDVEDYWERGKGSRPAKDVDYHNLAVWGFEVADAYNIHPGLCRERMSGPKDNWFALPSEPRLRTAYRVLNPAQTETRLEDTQIEIAKRIGREDGGIDHLIVALGANNCLGTVVQLKVKETEDTPPRPCSDFTLWSEQAFRADYTQLAEKVDQIGAANVYVATVPHVTIPPITRGVNKNCAVLVEGKKYFDYYTRFFIRDKAFDAGKDPHLTSTQAEMIDHRIDEYNRIIVEQARQRGWTVVDLCQVLDDLAVRRNHGTSRYDLPAPLSDLSIRFFEIHPNGTVKNGGLISLDGVHPTACGYGIVAQEFINAIRPKEPGIKNVDFAELRSWDPLVNRPPRTLDDMFGMLRMLERKFHMSRWMA
jgi:lysophospholipase L1-like esterase